MFSLYLSNNEKTPGKITFGGYDVAKFGKKSLKDTDVFWADQSRNEQYWAVNSKAVKLGNETLTENNQQLILDNGMSFAQAPEK